MNRDQAAALAREAGFSEGLIEPRRGRFLAFAELVAEREREACALACDVTKTGSDWKDDPAGSLADERSERCAEIIRAMKS